MIFDRERLDVLVTEGWLRSQRHPDADLWIFNYTEKTQYENHWTPETLACRGLILAADGEVVARPFAKFFNWGTPQAANLPLHEPFVVTEKYDGSLGILYVLDRQTFIASRGSFTSEQAAEGTRMLHEQTIQWARGTTPLFEIIYPSNRIVVDYGGRRELVLLGCIDNATGRDVAVDEYSGPRTPQITGHALDELATHERPNAEGYVVAFESGVRVKIKHAQYLRLHKIVTGVNARMLWESMRSGDSLDDLLTDIPDEIHDWITTTMGDLACAFEQRRAEADGVFRARPVGADRKALAQYFIASGADAAVLFRMLDGKPSDDLIWKAIRPGHDTPARALGEAA